MQRTTQILLVALSAAFALSAASLDKAATQIIEKAGVRQGLCVYLGDGNNSLAPALAANSDFLVHELCPDETSRLKSIATSEKDKLLGQVQAEIFTGDTLPYVPNSCTVIVVEDLEKLTRQGITKANIMNCLAPYGSLFIKRNDNWECTRKPRPAGMADYSHPNYLNTGNMVSDDKLLHFPLGLRWVAGIPKNFGAWATVRSWVVVGSKVFILTSNVTENAKISEQGPISYRTGKVLYLVARDAFNGLPLWKMKLDRKDAGDSLFYENADTLVADHDYVYTASGNTILVLAAATGELVRTLSCDYQPERLVKQGDVLLVGSWDARSKDQEYQEDYEETGWVWDRWMNKTNKGTLQAFDTKNGAEIWKKPLSVQTLRVESDKVLLCSRMTSPRQEMVKYGRKGEQKKVTILGIDSSNIRALDLKTGRELWVCDNQQLNAEKNLHLDLVSEETAIITERRTGALFALNTKNGSLLWKKPGFDPVKKKLSKRSVEMLSLADQGKLITDHKIYDLHTGEEKGNCPIGGKQMCTPQILVGGWLSLSRGCTYVNISNPDQPRVSRFRASRGGCMQGMVPANGMFYTCQTHCLCAPGQINGFLAFGPGTKLPSKETFREKRPVEQGPAFTSIQTSIDGEQGQWPIYRSGNDRARFTTSSSPENPDIAWKTNVAVETGGCMQDAWDTRLAEPLTPPVSAGGKVFTALTETGKVIALDTASGTIVWTHRLPARVDAAPTIVGNLSIIGCHDGWLYALNCDNGQLAWRTRIAPVAQRIVANGQLESTWPVVGSPLFFKGTIIANAGRGTEADNGVAIVQLDPKTGTTLYADVIPPGPNVRMDLLAVIDDQLQQQGVAVDLGKHEINQIAPRKTLSFRHTQYMLDAYLERFHLRGYNYTMAAWNGQNVVVRTRGTQLEAHGDIDALAFDRNGRIQLKDKGAKLWRAGAAGKTVTGLALNATHVFASATAANNKGFLTQINRADGGETARIPLPAPPVYDGMALANGRLCVVLRDGTILGIGK